MIFHKIICQIAEVMSPRIFILIYNIFWGLGSAEGVRFLNQKPTVMELLDVSCTDTILDVGCGTGMYTVYLTSKLTIALDADVMQIKFLQKHARKTFAIVADAQNLPFKESCFEKVLCTEVLEHLSDDACALREIYRVLKPSGIAVVSCPLIASDSTTGYTSREHSAFGHKRSGYEIQKIRFLSERCGFLVIQVRTCMFIMSQLSIHLARDSRKKIPSFVLSLFAFFDRLVPFYPSDVILKIQKVCPGYLKASPLEDHRSKPSQV